MNYIRKSKKTFFCTYNNHKLTDKIGVTMQALLENEVVSLYTQDKVISEFENKLILFMFNYINSIY